MPISDNGNYEVGQFKRVYDFIIKPACELAGFKPTRADDVLNTNYIALDIVKNIIQADMALCDLSGRNPNVMYELGIRQAFNKPVTLIKDLITERIFDISGFRDVSYDESLRVDTVQTNFEVIADTIKNTYETAGQEINSLVSLLGIEPAKIENSVQISPDTEIIMNAIKSLQVRFEELRVQSNYPIVNDTPKHGTDINNIISYNPRHTYPLDELAKIKVGDKILHEKFGTGTVTKMQGSYNNPITTIFFGDGDEKKVMLNYAKFTLI
ncbi:hypothetical protein [Segetibacter aerophilus]|uniref:Uncharacterized protein n=1 Tax=Segetibacter aerophilus TaxID=670293 RepID=A0A512B8H5_9BACT|nr:hypothetical protein [Segetibacter aerophilus]GEO08271.1 hypothetical protein SAE01_07670 [Segetibacter aerophilus]